jgi:hypothetical protein
MVSTRFQTTSGRRQGVILLVVITLLTLFAVVGITFVIFAQSEAVASRVWRESETMRRPDMDPEMLLAYLLNQFIYGVVDQNGNRWNPGSALQYHSLAENMYGYAPGSCSTIPFSGTGRVHTQPNPGFDEYYNIDYTSYPAGTPGIVPHPFLPAPNPQTGAPAGFSPNVPYTYPAFNNVYLSAVRPSDGAVLIPSYFRIDPNGTIRSLRPNTNYHTSFPPPEDNFATSRTWPIRPATTRRQTASGSSRPTTASGSTWASRS